jgi:hypothetical protein
MIWPSLGWHLQSLSPDHAALTTKLSPIEVECILLQSFRKILMISPYV